MVDTNSVEFYAEKISNSFEKLSKLQKMVFFQRLDILISRGHKANKKLLLALLKIFVNHKIDFGSRISLILSEFARTGTSFSEVFEPLLDAYLGKDMSNSVKEKLLEVLNIEISKTPKENIAALMDLFRSRGLTEKSVLMQSLERRKSIGDFYQAKRIERRDTLEEDPALKARKLTDLTRRHRGPERAVPLTKIYRK